MRALRGANAEAVIKRLNPIIRGWSAYYRTVVSSRAFGVLDDYMWKLTYKWAKHGHSNKSKHWIVNRYFGAFNKSRQDRWVFGDRESGAYLAKFAWTKIVRHQLVGGGSSPDDPALSDYWAARRRQGTPLPMARTSLHLLLVQGGCCALCQGLLLHADRPPQSPHEWEQWLAATRKALVKKYIVVREDGTPDETKPRLIHADCQRRLVGVSRAQHFHLPASLQGLLELNAVKAARPVLRGAGRNNAPGLPDRPGTSSSGSSTQILFGSPRSPTTDRSGWCLRLPALAGRAEPTPAACGWTGVAGRRCV
jgi:RNA-directed DNA polymerase